jgi:DNA modification methylase
VADLRASLRKFGQVRSIVVQADAAGDGQLIVAGHGVVAAAQAAGLTTLRADVIPADWPPAKVLAYLAADNELARRANPDQAQLAALVQQVQQVDAELAALAAGSEARLAELLASVNQGAMEDPGPQIDKAEELLAKWGVQAGDLWQLGEHRLICGDCTDAAVMARVMGGEKAQLVVTSPPYAVGKEYEAGVSFVEHIALLERMADRCIDNVVPGGFVFTNFDEIAAQSYAGPLTGSTRQCVYPISKDYWRIFHEERYCDLYAQRIWYKPFNRLQQPFWSYKTSIPHYQEWEHIWTWRTPGGDDDRLTDWDISVHAVWDTRNEATYDKPLTRHVAAFPVCLPERAIKAHSLSGELVLEPFSGSGTTLIACEKWGRRCRAVEIVPKYVAVALERWATMTGKTPVRMAAGDGQHG